MRVSELFLKKGTKFRDREVHATESGSHIDDVKAMIDDLVSKGKDYLSILRAVDYEHGPDAKYYARKYLSGNLNEEVWALPDTEKKVNALHGIMSQPLPAKRGHQALEPLLGTCELHDMLRAMADEDPEQDCRDAIQKYISVAFPQIDNMMRFDNDMLRNDNIEGTLSPLGHKDEEE